MQSQDTDGSYQIFVHVLNAKKRLLQYLPEDFLMQLDISSTNAHLSTGTMATAERYMRFALTRFSPLIRDVAVKFSDESGPKGAPTKKCQIVVRLREGGSVVVDATDRQLDAAASTAADRASRSVARQLERKRHNKKFQRRRADARFDDDSETLQGDI